METSLLVQNLKCSGCKNAILKRISKLDGIKNIQLDISSSKLSFEYTSHNALEGLRSDLADMGYPISGESNTIVEKTKSYIQCAVGRLSKE